MIHAQRRVIIEKKGKHLLNVHYNILQRPIMTNQQRITDIKYTFFLHGLTLRSTGDYDNYLLVHFLSPDMLRCTLLS